MKKRKAIPIEIKDKLLVECGYKCSVPNCEASQSLEFHHIDSDPSNNNKDNIIVLCAVHHHQADIKKISKRSLLFMKKLLIDIDGALDSPKHCDQIDISYQEIKKFLSITNEMPKTALRILTREFVRTLIGFNTGYHCRPGLDYHEFLISHGLVVEFEKEVPSLYKISEKGKILCKFLFTSQYNLPNAYFEDELSIENLKELLEKYSTKAYACFGRYRGKRKRTEKT